MTGDNNQFHILWRELGHLQRFSGRGKGHRATGLAWGGYAPLADTGPRPYPLVVGVDNLFQVGIGEHPLGHILAPSGNPSILGHRTATSSFSFPQISKKTARK
jgi:hypothetical protein